MVRDALAHGEARAARARIRKMRLPERQAEETLRLVRAIEERVRVLEVVADQVTWMKAEIEQLKSRAATAKLPPCKPPGRETSSLPGSLRSVSRIGKRKRG